ncbi:MAG TPA: tRNA pseudouridine(55) synthase TruB [bacterium]|nr:tRNA pseudouridine(55) synthase TruB [bacterium]
MDGILLIDKPGGMTSHDVVLRLRRLVPGARVGHAGTLDPNATGLLIGLVGKATKVSRFLMSLEKEYLFTIELGLETDTHDAWGQVVSKGSTAGIDAGHILDAASRFRGRYQQIAPSVSAIKHQGTPLYKLAREGQATPIKTRVVEIREFEVIEIAPPLVSIRVVCSSGTYVRSLARDMGRHLGCGAAVTSLRRVRVGTFGVAAATPLAELVEGRVQPREVMLSIEESLKHLPRMGVKADSVPGIRSGRQPLAGDLEAADLDFKGQYVALTDQAGTIIGIAVRSEESASQLKTERII